MATSSSNRSASSAPATPVQRLRLYGPSLITLAVLLPFFAYYLHEMKAAQGYLNDRAFRILDVTSRQFGSEITGVANTMGAAYLLPDQLALRERDGVIAPRTKWLAAGHAPLPKVAESEVQSYLNAYVLDGMASVKVSPKPPQAAADATAPRITDSLPQISICCRSGNSSTRIRFVDEKTVKVLGDNLNIRVDIRLDPDRMLARTFGGARGGMFETLFLASRNGQVLAETSSSRLTVKDAEAVLGNRRVRSVIEGVQSNTKEEPSSETTDQGKLPGQVWGADQRFDVLVSGTNYVLFVAPAPFVLTDEAGKETPVAFYGLSQKDDLDAQARRIPSLSLPVIFITLIVGMAFLWPALKLYTMSDRDRLTKFSVAATLVVTVLAEVLFGALYLSYGFFLDMSERSDKEIVRLAAQLRSNFEREIGGAIQQSESLLQTLRVSNTSSQAEWPRDSYDLLSNYTPSHIQAYPFMVHAILLGAKPKGEGALPRNVLDEPSEMRQIIKFSATHIPTPLITLPSNRYDFMDRLNQGQSASQNGTEFVIESFISPNTGEFLPIMVFKPRSPENASFRIMATTRLPSLVNAVLPQGLSFAVVDPDGQVLFHSDPSRNLHENFFGETDDPDELKIAMRRMEQKHLMLRYGGRSVRAFVQPLGCEGLESNANCIHNLGMGLIVFQSLDELKDRLSSVGANFLMYLLALPLLVAVFALISLGLKQAVWPSTSLAWARRRVWPRESDKRLYLLKFVWGLGCFICAAIIAVLFRVFANRFNILPLLLPGVLGVLWIVCILGAIVMRRSQMFLYKLKGHDWVAQWESRIPLSGAYSLRIFAMGLAVSGILSLAVYQLAVSTAQLRFESDSYRGLAAAIENRKLRYLADFHKSFADTPRDTKEAWSEFCKQRVEQGYDAYDWRIHEQPGVLSLLREAPVLNQFAFFDQSRERNSLPEACPQAATPSRPKTDGPSREPIWSILPRPSMESSAFFYLPCVLLFVGMFLWVHRIVRRLFILDYRQPDALPQLDEKACQERMWKATNSEGGPHDRVLIFAHPRSGTGVAMERILTNLKKQTPSIACCSIVDFGQTVADEISDHSKLLENTLEQKIAILDNFEVRLSEAKERLRRLAFLESLVYSHKPSVYVLTSIDPLLLMESLVREQPSEHLQSELNRWTRLLGNFERFVFLDRSKDADLAKIVANVHQRSLDLGLRAAAADEYAETLKNELTPTFFLRTCAPRVSIAKLDFSGARHFEDSLVIQMRTLADGYYRVIWLNCTSDERLALYQLAKDDWLNPLNEVAISHLLQKQLIYRDGAYRLMNASFRKFVLEAVSRSELAKWQKQQNLSLWPALRMALGLALFLVVLFVSYFWRDIFDVYLSYFVALAGGAAALFRVVTQFFTKDGSKLAALAGGEAGEQSAHAA